MQFEGGLSFLGLSFPELGGLSFLGLSFLDTQSQRDRRLQDFP